MQTFKDLLNRKELVSLVVALIVSALVASGLPAKVGLPIPESQLLVAVQVALAAFVAAIVEGRFKTQYGNAWQSLFKSTKFRLTALTLVGMAINTALAPIGLSLPDSVIIQLGQFAFGAVVYIGGADAWQAAKSS